MKKTIVIAIIISLITTGLMAQNSPYPEGNINLNINGTFGQNSDWVKLSTTDEFRHDEQFRESASFTISQDGSIYLVNNVKRELQLFNSEGKFTKTLAKINNIAQYRAVTIAGILDNKYIVTKNYDRLHIFNLDGSLFKIVYIDYPAYQVVPLKQNTIAIYTNVVYSGKRVKATVILKNILTGKEKELDFHIDDYSNKTYVIKKDRGSIRITFPYSRSDYFINKINNDQLLVGLTKQSELKIYDYTGQLVSAFDTKIIPLKIADSVKKEFKNNVKEEFYKLGYKEQFDKNPVDYNLFPSELPYYHAIQVDDKNNILVFVFTEGEAKQKADIYSNKGQLIGTSTFNCEQYSLRVNPASKMIHFGNKQIHAIIRESKDLKSPFKLIKLSY